jgi:pimeloyl-ACP methyl ester carboxylesterase
VEALARHGERLGDLRSPALILWPKDDPWISAEFGERYAEALGGETELNFTDGGHWSWLDRPELVERAARFLA